MSNQHTDIMCELVELYALDGLSEEESAAFDEHLKGCAVCRNQLIELKLVVDLLPMASEPLEVPLGMREQVLGTILGEPDAQVTRTEEEPSANTRKPAVGYIKKDIVRSMASTNDERTPEGTPADVQELSRRLSRPDKADRKARYWRLISLGLAAAVFGLGIYSYRVTGKMNGLRTEVVAVNNELTGVNKELTDVNKELAAAKAPVPVGGLQVNKIVALNPAEENIISKGLASIIIDNKGTHLIVQANDLPQIKQQEAFQVWLIKDNQPVNAGTFSPLNGKGVIYFTFEPKDYDTVSITLEPDANGVQPRGSIVLAGGLKS